MFDFNAAFHAVALILCLVSYLVLAGVIVYQWKLIHDLTNRLMAGNYREYQTVVRPESKQAKEEKSPRVRDDVLGATY